MITKYSLPNGCDFEKEFVGIVVDSPQRCTGAGDSLNLYIPALMVDIEKSIPFERVEGIGSTRTILINDSSCTPITKSHVKVSNYFKVTMENNSSKNGNWKRKISDLVNANSKFEMEFIHGYLSNPVFNTDKTL